MPVSSKRPLEEPVEPRHKKARTARRIMQLFGEDDDTNAKQQGTSHNLSIKPRDQMPDSINNVQPCKAINDHPLSKNALNTDDLDLKRYRCPTCSRGFPFKSHVKRHMVVHKVRRRPTQCSVCDTKFLEQEEGVRRSPRISKEKRLQECCQLTLRMYVFQRSLMKNQSIKGYKA